jgi:hypothetical protein
VNYFGLWKEGTRVGVLEEEFWSTRRTEVKGCGLESWGFRDDVLADMARVRRLAVSCRCGWEAWAWNRSQPGAGGGERRDEGLS